MKTRTSTQLMGINYLYDRMFTMFGYCSGIKPKIDAMNEFFFFITKQIFIPFPYTERMLKRTIHQTIFS